MSKDWISGQFFIDSVDLLKRYRTMFDVFDEKQTSRSKSLVDLLMAYETILKAILVHFNESNSDKNLHDMVKNYKHNVTRMVNNLPDDVPTDLKERHPNELTGDKQDFYKVDLRYAIESYWFRDAHLDDYYATISEYEWMDSLEHLVGDYIDWFGKIIDLETHVEFGGGRYEELIKIEYNPYRK